ncbi:uncharacterized protein LOC123525160 isoform X2 [Mercenaria mercenaria]|uniref:uncharacterized protein LOC123525160 isoform X2 n=1 Tax=Mercenaria mercenaria TaxID=6596 RepID=UPI00234E7B4A|nr:uncharacterized protein LOC123525160 isoform X2 [Mercenaria mercenaria]
MRGAQFLITMATVITAANTRCQCWNCCDYLCGKAISPRHAYFLEGEDIALTCSTQNISAENLTFLRGSNSDEVPQEFIHKLNDTAIKLIIPNVTSADIDSLKASTEYECVNKLTHDCYDNVHVRLEYYPREPTQLDCRIYDFDEMTCTWSLGVDYHNVRDMKVTCEYSRLFFKSDNPTASWTPCPDFNETACHWDSYHYHAAYRIDTKVSVTAIQRNITKEVNKTFYQHDIMEPGPVKKLKVSRAAGERCVELDWLPTDKYYSFRFIVVYNSTCIPQKMKSVLYFERNQTYSESRILCGLTPYTEYTYAVKGRLMKEKEEANKTYIEKGYWSAPEILTQRTDSDVLDVNPATSPGLYEISGIIRPGLQGYDSLQLYWTPLTDCDLHDNADNVLYKVTAYNMTTSVKHPAFMAQVDVPKSRVLQVTLQAINSIGPANSSRVLTVFPAKFGPSPSELILQYNKTDADCVTVADIVVREKQTNFSSIFHTLVWCEGTQLVCQEPIKWKQLGTNASSFVLPGNLCDVDYRYGLVTHGYHKGQSEITDTGIHWEPCIYQLGKVADKPLENVHLTAVQPSKGFSVEWNPYNCDEMKAYITHYMVTYCVGHGSDMCKCSEEAVSVNVSRLNSGYTASDLSPGSQVCIWVRGISKAGQGPANIQPLFHTIFANSGGINIVLIVAIISIFVLILLVTGLIICSCKIYKKWKRDNSQIRIVLPDENMPLNPMDTSDIANNSASNGTLPGYYSPERLEDNTDRKYSVGDITEVLEGEYIQPASIDSYMLVDENSDQTYADNSNSAENTDSKIPVGISENQPLIDKSEDIENTDSKVPVDISENKPLIDKSEDVVNTDSRIPVGISENQPLVDKSENVENAGLGQMGEERLTVKDGALYVGRPDKAKDEPGHCRYSISSVLSDAHTEQTNCSMDDLLWDHNTLDHSLGIADQGLDLDAILSPFDHHCSSKDKQSEEIKDSKGVDNAATFREGSNFLENEIGSNECRTAEPVDENQKNTGDIETVHKEPFEINASSLVDETEASESSIKPGNDEQWNSDNGFNFDETVGQLGDHYKQVADVDSGEATTVKRKSENEIDKCREVNGNAERVEGSITDQVGERSVENENTIKVNSSDNTVEEDEQNRNEISKRSLSSNSNGLISGGSGTSSSRDRTSGNSSGTLQSYVTADKDTFKEPNGDSSEINAGITQAGDKPKICTVNGEMNGTEQLHNTIDKQTC